MLELDLGPEGEVRFAGRFDATQCDKVKAYLDGIDDLRVLDFAGLEYISSAGLGILLMAQKRVMQSGKGLILVNVNSHINDIFRFSGFDQIFEVRTGDPV